MNEKGFMMAELVVVSSIVLVTLVGLYVSYNKIYSTYKTRLTYYDVVTLYRLGYYRNVLKENYLLDEIKTKLESEKIVLLYDSEFLSGSIIDLPSEGEVLKSKKLADKVYIINNNGQKITRSIFDGKNLHVTFLDYVDYLENNIEFSRFNYMMIMERCNISDEGIVDSNNCSYAYLEIY